MMTDAELAQLRSDILETLDTTVVIHRVTRGTADTYGYGGSATWAAVGTAAARVDPIRNSTGNEIAGAKEAATDFRQLTVAYATDIAQGDRVVYGSRTYEIRTLSDDHSLRAVRRAELVVTK